MKVFVRDFCDTVLARVVMFGLQVYIDMLYCGIWNKPSAAYFSLYLSYCLPFHAKNDDIFRQRFL